MKNLLFVFVLLFLVNGCGNYTYTLKSKSNGLYSCSCKVFWDKDSEKSYSVMECKPLDGTPVTTGTFYLEYIEN